MADLMDEDMADDGAQRFLVLGPVIENGAAIEENHIGQHAGMRQLFAMGEAHALEQSEQVELVGLHLAQHIVFRKILDPDDDIAGQFMEGPRQTRIGLLGQRIKILERRGFETRQIMQRKPVASQRSSPSAVMALTVV